MTNAGILAVGAYVPPEIRSSAWWPAEVVAGWRARTAGIPAPAPPPGITPGARRVLEASARGRLDPFHGVIERRVLAPELGPLDAAERAAVDALERARIDPGSIDLLLTHHVTADHALVNPACPLHERLHLSPACLALETEATGYTALAQIALAEAAIASGRARNALLVQVSTGTRLVDPDEPSSPIVGDGAVAIAMGPATDGRGILGTAHFTEGRYPRSLVMSVPGGRWYDQGRARMHVADPAQLGAAHLRTADSCEEAVRAALDRAQLAIADIDHLCVGQGNAWLHGVVAEQLGLAELPHADVFSRYGYLASAHVGMGLFEAARNGQLADNDVVAIVAGGTGMTYGAVVLRWERA